ncbi:MAG: DUF2807 domain-containing protein [Spirochaetaceae bacterium]|nr:DUF2807 domain-containing protein [Spirochaetaceae bacterium]MDT8297750.1 DUF2807 domain-containing protein [Spirochaetaceae bacterium]
MKKSQIAVLAALGLIVSIMIIVMGLGRLAVGSATRWDSDSTGWDESMRMDFQDFNTVVVEGAWDVRISQSESFSVDIDYPSILEDSIKVRVQGDRLVLGRSDSGNWHGEDLRARINMPSLSEIRIEGAAHVEFSGFDEKRLDVVIEGAGQVEGMDSETEQLNATLQGLGQIDLGDVSAENATVALDGAGEIVVRMDGGILDGRLQGLGSIVYTGEAADERIKVDGLGDVSYERR